jgi:hypothetical protein
MKYKKSECGNRLNVKVNVWFEEDKSSSVALREMKFDVVKDQ